MPYVRWKTRNGLPVCIILAALVLVLALALAGCDSAGDGDTGSGGTVADSSDTGSADGSDTGNGSADSGDTAGSDAGDIGSDPASGEAPSSNETASAADAEVIDSGGALTFDASGITEQASFLPLTVDGTYMEVIAVRAPDDTVRTAFNTCQVCWDSGFGYYIQEADELVCQNCGNRFNVNDVEVVRGGCNPVPIEEEYKTVDGDSVAIGYDILKEAVPLFESWKY